MSLPQALSDVRVLLQKSSSWTKGTVARDAAGWPCSPTADSATKRSIVGAVDSIARAAKGGERVYFALSEVLANRLGHSLIDCEYRSEIAVPLLAAFNDMTTHEGVLRLIDEALDQTKIVPGNG